MGDRGLPSRPLVLQLGTEWPGLERTTICYGVQQCRECQKQIRRGLAVCELDVKAEESLPRLSTARPPLRVRSRHRFVASATRVPRGVFRANARVNTDLENNMATVLADMPVIRCAALVARVGGGRLVDRG